MSRSHGSYGSQRPLPNQPSEASRQAYRHTATNVIESHVRHKLPTLVLKLQENAANRRRQIPDRMKNKHENDDELEHLLASSMADFKKEFNDNVDDFHKQVLSAKPHPSEQQHDPERYAARLSYYQELLQLANDIMKNMQQSVAAILISYRQYLDRLWEAIQAGHDVRPLQQQFEQQLRYDLDRHWGRVFRKADDLIQEIDANLGSQAMQMNGRSARQSRPHQ